MPLTDTRTDSVEDKVADAIEKLGPDRADITREASFEELDIDSLDLVELSQMAQEEWGVELEARDFSGVLTVGAAIDLIVTRLP
jgi:acyl carrier protein